jgi:hypothetical protein
MDLTQSINDLLRFRTKIFPGETSEVFAAGRAMNRLKSLHCLHVLKVSKPKARHVLLESASDELIEAIVEFPINTLNGNHKQSKEKRENSINVRNVYGLWSTQRLVSSVNVSL